MKRIILTALLSTIILSAFAQVDSIDTQKKINVAFGSIASNRLVGAVDVIDGELVNKVSAYSTSQGIKGLAAGLYGVNKVRGNSRGGNADNAMIVIDGVPNRTYDNIAPEDIESIQILKDATAKMLYGSKAANGVILITTKRGFDGKSQLSFSVETGMKTPTVRPEYLNSADYTRLYNQAEVNDDKDLLTYSAADLAAYADPNSDKVKYADTDFQDEFLKSAKNFTRADVQLRGGTDKLRYYFNGAYTRENGMVSVGDEQVNQRFNIRSNLDYKVNDIVSMNLDISTVLQYEDYPFLNENQVYNMIANHRPNDYALFVDDEKTKFGYGRGRVAENLYGELTRKGFKETKDYHTQNALGINLDLGVLLKGLSASAQVSLDATSYLQTGQELSYLRYQVVPGVSGDSLVQYGTEDLSGTQKKYADNFTRNVGGIGKVSYDNAFGKHEIDADFVYTIQSLAKKTKKDGSSVSQDDKGINLGLRANYAYDSRYVVQVSSSMMGSDKFTPENRWGLYGSAGAAWVISEESFLENSDAVSFLKLKASYGKMGYDYGYSYYEYRDEYGTSFAYDLGPNNSKRIFATTILSLGNPTYTFEESDELNVGLEATFFKDRLAFDFNYFNEVRTGMPTRSSTYLPDYVVGAIGMPMVNTNAVTNNGFDVALQYSDKKGDFYYSVGGNALFSKATYDVYDELFEYEELRMQGKETDALFGYVAEGLYQNDAEIAAHGVGSAFGKVMPGDIKYKNIRNDRSDNVIDGYDREVIGNTAPRLNYAVNINLEYKGFELYVLGQGRAGFDRMMDTYYQNYSGRKFTNYALGAANPNDAASIAAATHPRLTALSGNSAHSYRNSTYWMVDGGYFKLRTVELAYHLPERALRSISSDAAKVFIRANDLLTLSKTPEVDPESPNAGISSAPLFKTFTVGLKMTF